MNQELCQCGQPRNSIRHSFTSASSVDAHEFKPADNPALRETRPEAQPPSQAHQQDELKNLAAWLVNKSEDLMKQAMARRGNSECMSKATLQELKEAKKLAERMSGRKMRPVNMEENRRDVEIQNKIAEKLETESFCLSLWAETIGKLAAAQREASVAPPQDLLPLLQRAASMLAMLAVRDPQGRKTIDDFADELHETCLKIKAMRAQASVAEQPTPQTGEYLCGACHSPIGEGQMQASARVAEQIRNEALEEAAREVSFEGDGYFMESPGAKELAVGRALLEAAKTIRALKSGAGRKGETI